jgi:hypothetical protein
MTLVFLRKGKAASATIVQSLFCALTLVLFVTSLLWFLTFTSTPAYAIDDESREDLFGPCIFCPDINSAALIDPIAAGFNATNNTATVPTNTTTTEATVPTNTTTTEATVPTNTTTTEATVPTNTTTTEATSKLPEEYTYDNSGTLVDTSQQEQQQQVITPMLTSLTPLSSGTNSTSVSDLVPSNNTFVGTRYPSLLSLQQDQSPSPGLVPNVSESKNVTQTTPEQKGFFPFIFSAGPENVPTITGTYPTPLSLSAPDSLPSASLPSQSITASQSLPPLQTQPSLSSSEGIPPVTNSNTGLTMPTGQTGGTTDTIPPDTQIITAVDGNNVQIPYGSFLSVFPLSASPNPSIPAPPATQQLNTITFSFAGTDNSDIIQGYECSAFINNGEYSSFNAPRQAFVPCVSPLTLQLDPGSLMTSAGTESTVTQIFQVRAVDISGNVDPMPATFVFGTPVRTGGEELSGIELVAPTQQTQGLLQQDAGPSGTNLPTQIPQEIPQQIPQQTQGLLQQEPQSYPSSSYPYQAEVPPPIFPPKQQLSPWEQ